MHTQVRFRVECKDHFWYFEDHKEARDFALEWGKKCRPVQLFRVCEIVNSAGEMLDRLEQPMRFYETANNGRMG